MAANSQKERYPEVVHLLTKNKIFLPKKKSWIDQDTDSNYVVSRNIGHS